VSAPQLLPDVNDPTSAPFWAGARNRRIVMQKCSSCGALRYPPLAGCPECLSRDEAWVEIRQTGTIWSYAVYHRALHPAFADAIPYTVVVVELDDGPRITGRLVRHGRPARIGARVTAVFEDVTPDVTQVTWQLD
jgi:uncharacterized OB-fold protein